MTLWLFFLIPCGKYTPNLICVLAFLAVVGCQSTTDNALVATCYYPYEQMTDGLVYHYVSKNAGEYYWYYKSRQEKGEWYLDGVYYDAEGKFQQTFTEKIISNGVTLKKYVINELDSNQALLSIPVQILSGATYVFDAEVDGTVYIQEMQWTSPVDSLLKFKVTKNRTYARDTIIHSLGKDRPTVEWLVKEQLEVKKDGVQAFQYIGREYYAENVGLVWSSKTDTDQINLIYYLAETMTLEELISQIGGLEVLPSAILAR